MRYARFVNVRIGNGLFDLSVDPEKGVISSISPSRAEGRERTAGVYDANGLLYLPSLFDHHTHLDKHFLGEPWKPLQPFVTLTGQLAFERKMLAELPTTAAERARRLLDLLLNQGTTRIRTHIDVDPQLGLRHLEDVLRIREEYADRMEIEIVAFPQQGLLRSNSVPIMKEAMRAGADLVGGVDPAGLDRRPERVLEATFDLASEFDAGVDLHLHEPGHLGLFTIGLFAELTGQAGKRGRTAVSHAYCLGQVSEGDALEAAHQLKEHGVTILTSVPIDRQMPRVGQLLEAGVAVGVGTDNIRDSWSPFGDGDLLARGSRLAERMGWVTEEGLAKTYPLISASTLEPSVGDPATFLLADAQNPLHALAAVTPREAVFVRGKLVGGRLASPI